ncbi:hypothetical protein O3G_MSEX003790 [Manduca sexta]|uniref:BPTI/Kunitz inhibitor domain-containing protein n=1 Tax=Manduca sexta TaxID=7130 RepID=A0A921YSN7_MANSE|nr:hypothetical protein O3G_MSEX003790 [Manduca sexta]KAG6445186.1 hypothetical protein O3G_MSEX003790 [Manduca sexta]
MLCLIRITEVYITNCLISDSQDICDLKLYIGPCKANTIRYGFDNDLKQCRKFIYGGCQGNENNFETKEECEDACLD